MRYSNLAKDGWGTMQDAQQYTSQQRQGEAAVQSAHSVVVAAARQLAVLKTQHGSAEANLVQANAQRDQAKLNLSYTIVTGAQPGRVVQLSGAVGQYVQPGTAVAMFVPDDIWVTANFKETQLDHMRPGDKVALDIDAYPDRAIEGHVASVQPGSGTAFSLLPAENATGNYVKIVQRVPVKIVLDNPPADVSLGPGMSVLPSVRVDPTASFLVMLATGAILMGTTQFLPQLVQEDFGYTATWAGMVLSPGGIIMMMMMFVVGRLSTKVQPKYLIVAGAIFIALSMYELTNTYADLGFWFFARTRVVLGIGLPLIFLPIMAASYDGVPSEKTDQASALMNAARNTGGSIGISIVSNVLAHREQFHQSRLVEHAIPSSVQYQDTLQQVTNYFVGQGSSLIQAHQQAIDWIGQQVQAQASFFGYVDAFGVLMLISLAAVPLALALRKVKVGGPTPALH